MIYPISINGKVMGKIDVPNGMNPEEIKLYVTFCEPVKGLIEGKEVKKIIVVPERIINFVCNDNL